MISKNIQRNWYQPGVVLTLALLPLTLLYCVVATLRRYAYQYKLLTQRKINVTVIVVGNISVGGTGKTPLVVAIVKWLTQQGYRPGIISRGYGGNASQWPQPVTSESDPATVGDEAVLMAQRCLCPIYVGPGRVSAANALLASHDCDVIISDDGLQHYALARDIEIAVIDGQRRFGNGLCLPAGPLRETPFRLKSVDLVVNNGNTNDHEFSMALVPGGFYNLSDSNRIEYAGFFDDKKIHAVAGIGNNTRFFQQLKKMGVNIRQHPYNDHHSYTAKDLNFDDDAPIVMTEKDAVKCRKFANANCWYLHVEAELDDAFYQQLHDLLSQL
ncbi:MAG: tetraacyldisaccharide 4'-kinase [Gammaproteobacteria bacterium]|nr:tetraacyldisaccharide 4'-kinase [Gammaproteobacteria bacterium]